MAKILLTSFLLMTFTLAFADEAMDHLKAASKLLGPNGEIIDMKKLEMHLSKACDLGSAQGCTMKAAHLYDTNRPEEARIFAKMPCEKKVQDACDLIARVNKEYPNIDEDNLKAEICSIQQKIDLNSKKLKQEQEIGKISGVVNAENLHEAGRRILDYKEKLEALKPKYEAVSKKKWNPKSCI